MKILNGNRFFGQWIFLINRKSNNWDVSLLMIVAAFCKAFTW